MVALFACEDVMIRVCEAEDLLWWQLEDFSALKRFFGEEESARVGECILCSDDSSTSRSLPLDEYQAVA